MTLSAVFQFAETFVDEQSALDPNLATSRGVAGYDHLLTDLSPDGYRTRADHVRAGVTTVRSLTPSNDDDRLAREFISERSDSTLAIFDSGEWLRSMRAISSPASNLRAIFDLMPRDNVEAWDNIATRMHGVADTLAGLQATYELGRTTGQVGARRQVLAAADQAATWADQRWFDTLVDAAAQHDLPPSLVERIATGATEANAAYADFAHYLRDTYAPHADPADACGPERYRLNVRAMLGADLDPAEMYAWGWDDFHRLRAEIATTCEQILPGAGFTEVVELLETDPTRAEHSVDAYRAWLQAMTDDALVRSKAHFEIPEVMDRCEALIPPAGSAAAAYYTGPSEDFTRPGRTWYPTLDRTSFPRWSDVTTCYHESVPGHHLQIAYARLQADSLSRIQRGSFISGHGEGWALYAEQLCDEFGWFDNPDYRLGFLSAQMLRTVRVIVDIGMHLGYTIPAGTTLTNGTPFHPGDVWDADLAHQFSVSETGNTPAYMRSEIDRYLGWPAQAISYKIGQREWEAARADAMVAEGDSFDLRSWHTKALKLGPIGLDQLRAELRR